MISSRFELETFSVLDWRDNQLHHETLMTELCFQIIYKIITRMTHYNTLWVSERLFLVQMNA